jgi:arginyl-tRNA synthetase
VDPKKRILLKEESVDFAGNTGPFIQYTYAKIQSIIRKANFDFSNESGMGGTSRKRERTVETTRVISRSDSMQPKIIVLPWQIMYMI